MASFEIDRQTIKDLDLFNPDGVSVYTLFNQVKTLGGRSKLKEMMETPTFDLAILTSRRDSFNFFYDKQFALEVDKRDLDFIEHYLAYNYDVLRADPFDAVIKGLAYKINPNKDYYTIKQGIADTRKVLKQLQPLHNELLNEKGTPAAINAIIKTLGDFLNKKEIKNLLLSSEGTGYIETSYCDNLFRNTESAALRDVVKAIYELDVYISVANAAHDNGFCFAEYQVADLPRVDIKNLFHPCLQKPVKNDVLIEPEKNIWFLTGANMAGKSTCLKALSLAVYLAHVGFPVPADTMQTTLFNGLITTVNLSDNISSGYSHYFSEVKRLKKVAEKIVSQDNLFVVFDELFRGTNVKDAYDESLATINALSKIKNSVFLISTHIVEIATEIRVLENVVFKYFDSQINNDKPVFDFKLKDGVSSETLGYFIFKNEGILQILAQHGQTSN